MIKLQAGYGRKVPSAQEYSSENFHATVEIELPDSDAPRIKERLDALWGTVVTAVDAQIAHVNAGGNGPHVNQPVAAGNNGAGNSGGTRAAGNGAHAAGNNGGGNGGAQVTRAQPVNRVAAKSGAQGQANLATERQIDLLLKCARQQRKTERDETEAWLVSEYGCTLDTLDKATASAVIDRLQGKAPK